MSEDTTTNPPNATETPPIETTPPPSTTPGLNQLAPKSSKPSDDLLARARSTGLSRDILAWRSSAT